MKKLPGLFCFIHSVCSCNFVPVPVLQGAAARSVQAPGSAAERCTLFQDAPLQVRVQMWCVCPVQTAWCLWSPLSSFLLPSSCFCCFLKDRATRPARDVEDLDVLPIYECHSSPFYITSAQIPAWAPRDSTDELLCQETCLVDLHLCLLSSLSVRDPKECFLASGTSVYGSKGPC